MLSRFTLFVYVVKILLVAKILYWALLHIQFHYKWINVIPSTSVKHVKCLHVQTKSGLFLLTGSPTVTTPRSFTTLGCLNCPLMAASCRNLTLSSCEALDCSVFTATSTAPAGDCHIPLFTVPNWPEPRCSVILKKRLAVKYYKLKMWYVKLLTVFDVWGSLGTSYLLAVGRGPQSLRQDSSRWHSPQRMWGLAQQKNTGSRG